MYRFVSKRNSSILKRTNIQRDDVIYCPHVIYQDLRLRWAGEGVCVPQQFPCNHTLHLVRVIELWWWWWWWEFLPLSNFTQVCNRTFTTFQKVIDNWPGLFWRVWDARLALESDGDSYEAVALRDRQVIYKLFNQFWGLQFAWNSPVPLWFYYNSILSDQKRRWGGLGELGVFPMDQDHGGSYILGQKGIRREPRPTKAGRGFECRMSTFLHKRRRRWWGRVWEKKCPSPIPKSLENVGFVDLRKRIFRWIFWCKMLLFFAILDFLMRSYLVLLCVNLA